MEKNLTTGNVLKTVIFFSLPYLLSYFLQTLYGMADLFIIGQFEGVAATTAVSIGSHRNFTSVNTTYCLRYVHTGFCRGGYKSISYHMLYRHPVYHCL